MKPEKNLRILPQHEEEMEKIREEVKRGNCSTLRECVLLFEELWHEYHPNSLLISNRARKKLEKLQHNDPKQHSIVITKINQIQKNPEHYKPLSGDFYGFRRVHIGDFVLIYHLEEEKIVIMDYDHHKRIYE
ncbi:MAG: type II toxin-antitoxin system RelE family toxin [Methanobacterium sp.]